MGRPTTWTDNEIKLLLQNFYYYSDNELHDLFLPNKTAKAIESKIRRMNLGKKSPEVKQRGIEKMTNTKKEYYKTHDGFNKGKVFSEESRKKMSIAKTSINKWKGENNPRHINPLYGELNGRWKGGILDTYLELRSETKDWFNESMKFCGYKCVITGDEFDNVHHTTAFRDIVDEVFEVTKIDVKPKVCDYSVEEFNELRATLKDLHAVYLSLLRAFHNLL